MSDQKIPETETGSPGKGNEELSEDYFEKATGRSKYFKPEPNKRHDVVLVNWKPYKGPKGDAHGISMDVIKLDGEEITVGEKFWSTTAVRIVRALEPIIMAAQKKKQAFLHIEFQKVMAQGDKDTDAKFLAKNLDPMIDEFLPEDLRTGGN